MIPKPSSYLMIPQSLLFLISSSDDLLHGNNDLVPLPSQIGKASGNRGPDVLIIANPSGKKTIFR